MDIFKKIFGKNTTELVSRTKINEISINHSNDFIILEESINTLVNTPKHEFEINVQCGRGLRNIDSEVCKDNVSIKSGKIYSEELVPLLLDILNKESLRADFHNQTTNTLSNIVAFTAQ